MKAALVRPLLLALAAAGLAGALAASEPPTSSDPAAALGGVRPIVVGSLFLRAEALRREGRVDEVPAIYRRILELDPTSTSAADHLADVLANDLAGTAPTPAGRVRWWREAAALVDTALARAPDDVRLWWRRADLLLAVAGRDPAVAAALAGDGRDRELEGLRALREAFVRAGDVPRLGRIHLEMVARYAPRVAAARLAQRRDGVEEALRIGVEALARRAAELDELVFDARPDAPPAAAVLMAGLRLVETVRDDLAASPPRPDDARRLLEAYDAAVGDRVVVDALQRLLP